MAVFHPRTRFDSYVEGRLSPSAQERVSAHLADCETCWQEVDQRRRILRITSSLGPLRHADHVSEVAWPHIAPQVTIEAVPDGGQSEPVVERRSGVPGWKVVLSGGAVGLLAAAVLTTAWIAGDPAAAGDDQSRLLASTRESSSSEGHDDGRSPAASPTAPGVAGPSGTAEAALSSGASPATRLALAPGALGELRQSGWNVPTFHGLGMVSESAGWHRGEDLAEVVVVLADDAHTLRFHECRTLLDQKPAPSCPLGWIGNPMVAQDAVADSTAVVVGLPVGVDMVLHERSDGTWTATVSTAQASYAVDSDLPVRNAPQVMSMVVISERSRVQAGTTPESPGDRLARGFERLNPWTEVTDPE